MGTAGIKGAFVKLREWIRDCLGFAWAAAWLCRNMGCLRHGQVYLMWPHSFGHTVLGLDMGARIWHPLKVVLIYFVDETSSRKNNYLPLCFEASFDSVIIGTNGSRGWIRAKYMGVRKLIFWANTIKKNHLKVFEHAPILGRMDLYFDKSESRYKQFIEQTGQLGVYHDPGNFEVMSRNSGAAPRLSTRLLGHIRSNPQLQRTGFFRKPFVTLLLRERGKEDENYYNYIRCSGPQKNYRDAVIFLVKNGFHVVGTGETNHDVFRDIPEYFIPEEWGLHPELANIFALTEAALFIGQHSGPFYLPNSCGVPVLLCDVMPYWQATSRSEDLLVYKKLFTREGRHITPVEVFREHKEFAYGQCPEKSGFEVQASTSREILAGAQEMVHRIRGGLEISRADRELIVTYRENLPRDMLIGKVKNRPPLELLREYYQ